MAKKENIVRYTREEIQAMFARGESQSDFTAAAAMSDEELAASIAADPDEAGLEFDWLTAMKGFLNPRRFAHAHRPQCHGLFPQAGKGYQTKINHVLASYVAAQKT